MWHFICCTTGMWFSRSLQFKKLFVSVAKDEITLCRSGGVNKHFAMVQSWKDCLVSKVLAMEFRDVGSVLKQSWHVIFLFLPLLPIKWGLYYFVSSVVPSHLNYRHFRTAAISWLYLLMHRAIRIQFCCAVRRGIIQGRNAQDSACFIKILFTKLLFYLILLSVVGYKSVIRNAERNAEMHFPWDCT